MTTRITALLSIAALLCFVSISPAQAEVEVSLEISGEPSELIAILNLLRQEGFGGEALQEDEDALKIRVESFGGEGDREEDPEEETVVEVVPDPIAPPAPLLVLANPIVTPKTLSAGEEKQKVLVSLALIDERSVVDTIAMTFRGRTFDLNDMGGQGDQIAGDGIWSGELYVGAPINAGEYDLNFVAFNAHGAPVMTGPEETATALSASTQLIVQN